MTKIRRHVGRYLTHPAALALVALTAARGDLETAVHALTLLALAGALPGASGGPHRPAG